MAEFQFPRGNQYWNLRSKHGRDKLFATPELMLEAAYEYFEWINNNPLIQVDFKGKDAERVEIPHTRPYTIHGLCQYLSCNLDYFNDFQNSIKDKDDDVSRGYSRVIKHIKEIIYRQKFEGASCGFYNANIISRDLGLIDKVSSDIKQTTEAKIIVSDNETKQNIDKLIERFESE